jgi:hypothetical protein
VLWPYYVPWTPRPCLLRDDQESLLDQPVKDSKIRLITQVFILAISLGLGCTSSPLEPISGKCSRIYTGHSYKEVLEAVGRSLHQLKVGFKVVHIDNTSGRIVAETSRDSPATVLVKARVTLVDKNSMRVSVKVKGSDGARQAEDLMRNLLEHIDKHLHAGQAISKKTN